jgi:hypothetical protein
MIPVEQNVRMERVNSQNKKLSVLDMFSVKKGNPQPRESISPNAKVLRQIKSEKFLPELPAIKPEQQPVSTKVLPEVPSFKSIIHSF